MEELGKLLQLTWGSEPWIKEGWDMISPEEQALIKSRMDLLFKNGLPFELTQDKLFYIYSFSLLAQLEVLAIQVPLKFESKMSSKEHRERLHQQLLDEIFHGLVFTKIVYLLCAPYAFPPAYNAEVESLCNFIRQEDCPKVALVLLNLIAEGWIEEIFKSFQEQNVAPAVFEIIMKDEHRHVCEADLYQDIGLPAKEEIEEKLHYLEEKLLTSVFLQDKYMLSGLYLLGVEGGINFLQALNKKHIQQLAKINLKPSENWLFGLKTLQKILPEWQGYTKAYQEVQMTAMRHLLMTQWQNPQDPTMVGEFNLNISCLDFFNKKFPSESLTLLMMQTLSQLFYDESSFRLFLSNKKLYQAKDAYIGLIVKLPDCADHIGTIIFENCHNLTIAQLALKIKDNLKMMSFCFKKREQLEKEHPHLRAKVAIILTDYSNDNYPYPAIPGSSVVSLTNIGNCGYSRAKSPLRPNEGLKFTLLEIERKPVWNTHTQQFEPQDILPISLSADHRIFDGNIPIPKLLSAVFKEKFLNMQLSSTTALSMIGPRHKALFSNMLAEILEKNLEFGYKLLGSLQTCWPDFLALEKILLSDFIEKKLQELS